MASVRLTPFSFSQRSNFRNANLAVWAGKKQHSSDQWWEKAFDNQLKNLDVASAGGEVTVTQTAKSVTPAGLERIARFYIRFVRGGVLHGDREIAGAEREDKEVSIVRDSGRKGEGKEKEKKNRDERKERRSRDGKRNSREKKKRKERKLLKRMVKKEMAALKGRK